MPPPSSRNAQWAADLEEYGITEHLVFDDGWLRTMELGRRRPSGLFDRKAYTLPSTGRGPVTPAQSSKRKRALQTLIKNAIAERQRCPVVLTHPCPFISSPPPSTAVVRSLLPWLPLPPLDSSASLATPLWRWEAVRLLPSPPPRLPLLVPSTPTPPPPINPIPPPQPRPKAKPPPSSALLDMFKHLNLTPERSEPPDWRLPRPPTPDRDDGGGDEACCEACEACDGDGDGGDDGRLLCGCGRGVCYEGARHASREDRLRPAYAHDCGDLYSLYDEANRLIERFGYRIMCEWRRLEKSLHKLRGAYVLRPGLITPDILQRARCYVQSLARDRQLERLGGKTGMLQQLRELKTLRIWGLAGQYFRPMRKIFVKHSSIAIVSLLGHRLGTDLLVFSQGDSILYGSSG